MSTDSYSKLRAELKAFHSTDGLTCENPARIEQAARRTKRMEDYAAEHPEDDALALRRQIYAVLRDDFVPVIFPHSPFYFEVGGNGGWNRTSLGFWLLGHETGPVIRDHDINAWRRFNARIGRDFYRCAGPYFDAMHNCPAIHHLLQAGFKGIWEQAVQMRPKCTTDHERDWLETAIDGLLTVKNIAQSFADEAQKRLETAADDDEKACMQRIADSARVCPWEPPRTFYEALNLCAFVREITAELEGLRINSLGRPDAWLITFYENDIANGRLTADEAYDLICRFLLMGDLIYDRDAQIAFATGQENELALTLGGCNPDGSEVFNDLTRLFLKAYRELNLIYPKPHCRFSHASSSEYLRLIGDDILNGHCVYSLLNDDAIIPALTATGHSLEDARNVTCTGCWDLVVDSCEDNSGGNYVFLSKIIEATIQMTDDELENAMFKPKRLDNAQSFEDVYAVIMDNTRTIIQDFLRDLGENGKLQAKAFPAPMHSACCHDCLQKLKDFTEGGHRYNPHAISLGFWATFVDSLLAIKTACFDANLCSLQQLLNAVRNNWQGAEALRQQILKTPHWGDGSQESTALARRIADDLLNAVRGFKNEHGGDFQLGIWVYREFLHVGKDAKATPDGRYDGDECSQSLNPSHFRNHEPLTTVLTSLAELDLKRFAANSVTNLFIERKDFSADTVEALIRTFAQLKLQLLQLNCTDADDLLEAQRHPEKYGHIIVRICGYSAKFTSLLPVWQQEIINRTKY